ncbi:MAG: 50S ribosomal protein L9 [Clostridiaceae bacterium]|nr:50S ribosomal protein L9 [Clostridiaceae bacterium]
MKVILTEGVKKLGQAGDVIEVKRGYAENFLFKKGLAVPATAAHMNEVKAKAKARADSEAKQLEEAQKISDELSGKHIEMKVKTGSGGRLYGTITAQNIADYLQKDGYSVDKRDITLAESVKTVGTYEVTIRLHPSISTNLFIDVKSEE